MNSTSEKNSLAEKAVRIEQYIEDHFIDQDGMVYACINSVTHRPWIEQDFAAGDDCQPVLGITPWDFVNYENSGMTTGSYLAAQSFKWRVTKDERAYARAKKAFKGICRIYELGRQKEEGFFPKTYGGRFSHELSSDQYQWAIKGMMEWLPVAPWDDAASIRRMVPKMVDYWMKRKYHHDYFALKDLEWPLGRFVSLLYAAHAASGDQKYLDEAERLHDERNVHLNPPDGQILHRARAGDAFSEIEKSLGDCYLAPHGTVEVAAMDIMDLDLCLNLSKSRTENWLQSVATMWEEGTLCLDEDGFGRVSMVYDPRTSKSWSPEPQWIGGQDPLNWGYLRYIGGHTTARSTQLARVGIHVAKWLPEKDAMVIVKKILRNVDMDRMLHVIDPDGHQVPDPFKFMCRMQDGDAITNWLWAYWQGRFEGRITADE